MKHTTTTLAVLFVLFLLLQITFYSCNSLPVKENRLEEALIFAGDNREELEKVLSHYHADSLKLQAAIFLIENMPYYYTYKGKVLDSLYVVLMQVCDSGRYDKDRFSYLSPFPYSQLTKEYDSRIIKADYLIENIDYSFKVWRERPWGKYISFADFCEFILPYRIKNEPLTHWKRKFYDHYTPILDSLYNGTDVVEACTALNHYLISKQWNYFAEINGPHLPADFLIDSRVGDCRNMTDHALYVMRSVGIPVARDSYFYSPARRNGHAWNALLDTTGRSISFFDTDFDPERGKQVNYVIGKVYRHCFAFQQERALTLKKGFRVPSPLNNFFLKDVSSEYFATAPFYVDCDYIKDSSERPVWLGIFSTRGWIPIGEGEYKDGRACFQHAAEADLFYATLYDDGTGNLCPAGPAFKIDPETGIVLHFRPSGDSTRLVLRRKYPFSKAQQLFGERMRDGRFEASNSIDFTEVDTLHTIVETPNGKYYTVDVDNTNKYRYLRYISNSLYTGDVAEIAWYERDGNGKPLRGKILSSLPYKKTTEFDPSNVVDGNGLTYFSSADKPGWIIFDLGVPKSIERIKYMPRNDDNFIRIGDTYELFYYTAKGWKSLGQQIADSDELIYINAPEHALFWLRNLTRGREEQIFSYYGGKQHFNLKEVVY